MRTRQIQKLSSSWLIVLLWRSAFSSALPPEPAAFYIEYVDAGVRILRAGDCEFGRALARGSLAAAGEAREHGAVPQSDDAFFEEPSAAQLDELVFVVAGEAEYVWRLALALRDKNERARGAAAAIAFHDQLA